MTILGPTLVEIVADKNDMPAKTGSLWQLVFRRLIRQRSSRIGIFVIVLLFSISIFAKQIAPYDPAEILIAVEDVMMRSPPCIHLLGCPVTEPQHLMGTDSLARDYFSRIIYGTRISLFIGFATVGLSIIIGTFLGALAGYRGGWLEIGIMGVMDVLLAFPVLLLALGVVAIIGPGLRNTFIAITVVQIPHYARIIRASVLSLKETEFVKASRALGGGHLYIVLYRILPSTLTPLIVKGTLGVASAILDAAALSFLGLGSDLNTPEWGTMLGLERNSMFSAPYLLIFPGIALTITVLAFNLLGDGLRDSLDPRI